MLTQIDPFRKVADELGALLVVDTVASLVGTPLDVDRQRIDICFSGTQKAISAPPGMAPITVNARVEEVIRARKTKVSSWYFDLTPIMTYWGKERTYHHTPPIPLVFGLREALRIVLEEGLEASWERHRQNQLALIAGVEAMGLQLFVPDPAERMPTVTGILPPAGVDEHQVRRQLLEEFSVEIAGGIGTLKGKLWRVGLMGFSSQKRHVLLFLAALEKALFDQNFKVARGSRRHRGVALLFTDGSRSRRAPQVTDHGASPVPANTIPNRGTMSEFVGAFGVPSNLTDVAYQVKFSHLWNGVATRHSDTIDTKFLVDGRGVIVGLAHTAFVRFRESSGRDLTDREASYVAAEYLRERLQQEDERDLYDVPEAEVLRIIKLLEIS